jgi:ectoine hydroxylase-related dioxygenase (phytanoyl-CoA dioxygenase family)
MTTETSLVQSTQRLTAEEMADFVMNGFLLFDGLVPDEWNQRMLSELKSYEGHKNFFWFQSETIQKIFGLPKIKAIIDSLLGEHPVYDHSSIHIVGPKHLRGQYFHSDSMIDSRRFAFDVQAFYFPHDTPEEMGPTLVLPGSHLRLTSNRSLARLKNVVGQMRLAGKAGTVGFLHHGIWHCAQPNHTDTTRYMFKLRLRPGQPQRGLFDLTDYDSEMLKWKFQLLTDRHQWLGTETGVEQSNYARLWRYVTGDDHIDVSPEGVLTRIGETIQY